MARLVNSVDLKRNTTNHWIIAALFIFTGLVSVGFWLKGRSPGESLLQPYKISYNVQAKKIRTNNDTSRATTQFLTTLQDTLQDTQGSYSIYVYRLNEDKGYGLNEDVVMPAASIMKIPIMTAVLSLVDGGQLRLTDSYPLNSDDIRSGSGPLEFVTPGTQLTLDYLLKVSGQNSDNTAPVILDKIVGVNVVKAMISKLGMASTSFDDNTTTAADLGAMWKNLYAGNILSSNSHDVLWTDLENSIYEDRLPAGVPDNVEVVHKVGSDSDLWSDSGIVLAKEPFVLSILTQGVDLQQAQALVPKITKMIWNYESARTTPPPPTPTKVQSK